MLQSIVLTSAQDADSLTQSIKIFIAKLDKRESNLEKIGLYSIFNINKTY